MIDRQPEGYRKLLVYQKSVELQKLTEGFIKLFPRTKTFIALADQISRSMRSVTKNIVEGWMRNRTHEYFQFLGYAIGSCAEMMEDYADIATGVYGDLMGIRGIMGEMLLSPIKPFSRESLGQLKFYPLNTSLPSAVQLFLRSKEIIFLLYRLQKSLDLKMDEEMTSSVNSRARKRIQEYKKADSDLEKLFEASGLIKLENGRWIKKQGG